MDTVTEMTHAQAAKLREILDRDEEIKIVEDNDVPDGEMHVYEGDEFVASVPVSAVTDYVETLCECDVETATWCEDHFIESVSKSNDPVSWPAHYTEHPSGVECIEITEHMNFCLGNAMKYIWRAGLKSDDVIQDLEKAAWYIDREIERLKK